MSLSLEEPGRRRRPSLTPMIDVVFLLLIFFMLAARFGTDMFVPLQLAGDGAPYSGPMRLVDVTPDGVRLNGRFVSIDLLLTSLDNLTETPADVIVLRARDGATLQQLVAAMQVLTGHGFTSLTLVEAPS